MVEATILARLRDAVSEDGPGPFHHFTVDGTLIEAWASLKSLRSKGAERNDRTPPDDPGNPSVDFHGQRRQNATHQSTTDPEARLAKKGSGKEAKLCYTESVLMENRNGIMVDLRVGRATGRTECAQGLEMLEGVGGLHRITVAADKGYDRAEFVAGCRALNVTPHVAQNERRPGGSALDLRTTGLAGIWSQSARAQAGRGDLRLTQDGRQLPPHPLSRLGVDQPCRPSGRRGLQPPQDRETLSQRMNRAAGERQPPPPPRA